MMTGAGHTNDPHQAAHAHSGHGQSGQHGQPGQGSAGQPQPDPAIAIDVRNQVVGRLRRMNVLHAQHAWEQRYSDPLAPYGLAFLYAEPSSSRPDRLTVRAATKLWLAGPETADLPRLLFGLNEYVGSRLSTAVFDVRTELANRSDEMGPEAFYIGVALSTLDTHSGVWEQIRERVPHLADVPGRALIVLTDQTTMICERRGFNEFNAYQIHSTHSLGDAFSNGVNPWSWSTPDLLRADPANTEILRWLDNLNLTLWQAENARLVAQRSAQGRRGGDRGR
jgi:hypothetical protein